jgi:hypothetical protein
MAERIIVGDGEEVPALPSPAELQARIVLWSNRLPVGSEWKHWSGTIFEIVGFGIDRSTGEVEVQYQEASLTERAPPLYAVGSIAPLNPDVIMHRPATDWEKEVTIHKGQMVPAEVIRAMTADQKLYAANERRIVPRHRRVQRIEQFVEVANV